MKAYLETISPEKIAAIAYNFRIEEYLSAVKLNLLNKFVGNVDLLLLNKMLRINLKGQDNKEESKEVPMGIISAMAYITQLSDETFSYRTNESTQERLSRQAKTLSELADIFIISNSVEEQKIKEEQKTKIIAGLKQQANQEILNKMLEAIYKWGRSEPWIGSDIILPQAPQKINDVAVSVSREQNSDVVKSYQETITRLDNTKNKTVLGNFGTGLRVDKNTKPLGVVTMNLGDLIWPAQDIDASKTQITLEIIKRFDEKALKVADLWQEFTGAEILVKAKEIELDELNKKIAAVQNEDERNSLSLQILASQAELASRINQLKVKQREWSELTKQNWTTTGFLSAYLKENAEKEFKPIIILFPYQWIIYYEACLF